MDNEENVIPLLFMGYCLVMADCYDSTVLALSEYAIVFLSFRWHSFMHGVAMYVYT
jgi:hypothetical protein